MRVKVLGVGFDNITKEEAVAEAMSLLDSGGTHYVVTPNPEIVEVCREQEEVAWAVNGADLVLPDGIGVIKGAAILGTPLRERVPGIEFANGLLAEMEKTGHTLYLLGGKPGVAVRASKNLARTYPGLRCVGFHNGYFYEDEPVIEEIQRSGADVVFVCLGAPKQELWMLKNGPETGAKLLCGLGGSLDVFAGTAKRAPEFFCKHGLEWFYRLCKEPWRWKRMMKLPLFLVHVWREKGERKKLPPERPALEILADKLFPEEAPEPEEVEVPPVESVEPLAEAPLTDTEALPEEPLTESVEESNALTEEVSEDTQALPEEALTGAEVLLTDTETLPEEPLTESVEDTDALTGEVSGDTQALPDTEPDENPEPLLEERARQEDAGPMQEGRSTEEPMADFEHQDTTSWDARQVRGGQEPEAPPKRRRRKSGMGFLRVVAYLFVVVVVSVILASFAWELASDLCAFNRGAVTTHTVEISPGDDIGDVIDKLHDAGLIKYPFFFRLFADVTHAETKIGAGSYALTTDMDYRALVVGMRNTSANLTTGEVKVTIPEGYTVRDICALLAEKGVASEEALLEAARDAQFDFSFINNDSHEISRLEGYLFPDTYDFYTPENPERALHRLLSNFARKIDAWQENLDEAAERGYTLKQIVTIASLIEKETDGTDQARIASVIYNRLNGPGSRAGTYGLLQIDASVLYGIPNHTGPITSADLESSSPYNLYKNAGLPPTAIANPGSQSLLAAMAPEETEYYYYALAKDRKHRFFTNYSDFSRFLASSDYIGN